MYLKIKFSEIVFFIEKLYLCTANLKCTQMLIRNLRFLNQQQISGCGEIGRRARLRI